MQRHSADCQKMIGTVSFVAALSADKIQMVKLYSEGNPEARFKMNGVKQIFFYCNRDGLFFINVNKAIDGRDNSYDDIEERRKLEQAAKCCLDRRKL